MDTRQTIARVAIALLTLSGAGLATWKASEGFSSTAHIPTVGDVPTIGHGSTRYEDGRPVLLTDPPITRERADQLARHLHAQEEARFKASLPGVLLYQGEYDLYLDFVGQFGIGNWRASSMRRRLLAGDYQGACQALLAWRYAGGYDCSTPGNRRCAGVWDRQQKRHAQCLALQTP